MAELRSLKLCRASERVVQLRFRFIFRFFSCCWRFVGVPVLNVI